MSNRKKRACRSVLFLVTFALLAAQCGEPATPQSSDNDKGVVRKVEDITETETSEQTVETERVPLNNCGGNSPLTVDVERSREIIYAITDEKGGSFGVSYFILKGELNREYGSIDGKKEKQTYTLHLEAEENSHVEYTIAWKEIWVKGKASVVTAGGDRKDVPYQVKRALRLEVQDSEEFPCQ